MNPNSISIANFKSFGSTPAKFPLRPITLVFGPNSSGKSSLLQSLLFFDHTAATGNTNVVTPRHAHAAMDLGGFDQFINRQSGAKEVTLSFGYDWDSLHGEESAAELKGTQWTLSLSMGRSGTTGISIEVDGGILLKASRRRGDSLSVDLIDFDHPALEAVLNTKALDMGMEPIRVPDLAKALGLKTFNVMADLIKLGVFPSPNEPIGADVAAEVCSIHGFSLLKPAELLKAVKAEISIEKLKVDLDKILPVALSFRTESGENEPNAERLLISPERMLNILSVTITDDIFAPMVPKLKSFSGSLHHIPPMRELPPRSFDLNQNPDSVWTRIIENPEVRTRIDIWLGGTNAPAKHMHSRYRLDVREYLPTDQLKSRLTAGLDEHAHTLIDFSDPNFGADLATIMAELASEFEALDKLEYAHSHSEVWDWLVEYNYHGLIDARDMDLAHGGKQCGDLAYMSDSDVRARAEQLTEDELANNSPFPEKRLWNHFIKHHQEFRRFIADHLDIDASASEMASNIRSGLSGARRELALRALPSNVLVALQDVGLGISQALPILAYAFGETNRFIAIEEPECHGHPRLQSAMADIFIESALGKNKNTFLIETHSEHLILRVLRRIRETARNKLPKGSIPVTRNDVAVLYIEPDADGTVIRELKINDQGRFIDEWPHGFFEDRLEELL
jgi:hypothetical protein